VGEVEIVAIVKAPWIVESAETLEITHINQKILTIPCIIILIGNAPQACVSIFKTANAR
jgi:precorrin isomerase